MSCRGKEKESSGRAVDDVYQQQRQSLRTQAEKLICDKYIKSMFQVGSFLGASLGRTPDLFDSLEDKLCKIASISLSLCDFALSFRSCRHFLIS